jgi:hypothetical protein
MQDEGLNLTIRLKNIILDEISKNKLTENELASCLMGLAQYFSDVIDSRTFKKILLQKVRILLRGLKKSTLFCWPF